MNKGQRLIAALLAAAIVLLALNLTRGPSEAQAQPVEVGPTPPQVVSITWDSGGRDWLFRQYDDGSVEALRLNLVPGGQSCDFEVVCVSNVIDFCIGDNNYDGVVDVQDLLNMLALWGPCPVS